MTLEAAIEGRRARMRRLVELLEQDRQRPLEQIVAQVAVETGVTERTVQRYLETLRRMGYGDPRLQ
jgi:predicted DNA-binding transcriptional regulator YafY